MLLDNLKDIFLKALKYTPALEQKAMIDFWNKECDSVWKDKEALIKETRAACRAGISPEEIAHAKDLLAAEKDGQLYTVHDVAVILASAIGDDCACNINSNDEWLPQLCELQEACPEPVGVACWEQYLKHRAEAEKALGKEQDER